MINSTHYHCDTLCYIVLHCATWCYIVLHCATLCYMVLHCATLCYIVLHGATLCYTVLHGATLCYIVLHCATLCYMVLPADKACISCCKTKLNSCGWSAPQMPQALGILPTWFLLEARVGVLPMRGAMQSHCCYW